MRLLYIPVIQVYISSNKLTGAVNMWKKRLCPFHFIADRVDESSRRRRALTSASVGCSGDHTVNTGGESLHAPNHLESCGQLIVFSGQGLRVGPINLHIGVDPFTFDPLAIPA